MYQIWNGEEASQKISQVSISKHHWLGDTHCVKGVIYPSVTSALPVALNKEICHVPVFLVSGRWLNAEECEVFSTGVLSRGPVMGSAVSPKDLWKSSPPVPQNVTLFRNSFIADTIGYIKMRSYWNRMGPSSNMTGVFIRVKLRHRYTQTVDHHGKTEVRIGVIQSLETKVPLETKEPQRFLAIRRSWARCMEQSLRHSPQKEPALVTPWI